MVLIKTASATVESIIAYHINVRNEHVTKACKSDPVHKTIYNPHQSLIILICIQLKRYDPMAIDILINRSPFCLKSIKKP